MKKTILFFAIILTRITCFAQGDSLYVSGRFLYNNCGGKIILHGINYPVLDDWDFPQSIQTGNERLAEIGKTGVNAVRIQWYIQYKSQNGQPRSTSFSLKDLDTIITRCARMKMIPIVGLWDLTTQNNWQEFNTTILNWYMSPDVKNLIKKHQRYLIINIANEMGHYEWSGDQTVNENNFKTNYKSAISTLRGAGIHVPFLIDAPDGGSRLNLVRKVGKEIIMHDPLKNILFGVHTYWAYYPNWQQPGPAEIANEFNLTVNLGLPVVIGEVANIQDEQNQLCKYDLTSIYPEVLKNATRHEIGYFAWSWYKDGCSNRQVSVNGIAAQLTAWGNDFVNNPVYGIKNTSAKSDSTFTECICKPYRFLLKKCTASRRYQRTYVSCTMYRNKYTGENCKIICDACNPNIGRRHF